MPSMTRTDPSFMTMTRLFLRKIDSVRFPQNSMHSFVSLIDQQMSVHYYYCFSFSRSLSVPSWEQTFCILLLFLLLPVIGLLLFFARFPTYIWVSIRLSTHLCVCVIVCVVCLSIFYLRFTDEFS